VPFRVQVELLLNSSVLLICLTAFFRLCGATLFAYFSVGLLFFVCLFACLFVRLV